jgi:hypothetical protein
MRSRCWRSTATGRSRSRRTPATSIRRPRPTAELDAVRASCATSACCPVMETGARFLLDPRHKHEPTLMTRDPAARQRRIDFYAPDRGDGGAARGQGGVVLGRHRSAAGPDSEASMDARRHRGDVRRIRAEGLTPSLEPEPGMALETVADWHRMRSALGSDAPAMTLDIGHLYAVWEGDPVALVPHRTVPGAGPPRGHASRGARTPAARHR